MAFSENLGAHQVGTPRCRSFLLNRNKSWVTPGVREGIDESAGGAAPTEFQHINYGRRHAYETKNNKCRYKTKIWWLHLSFRCAGLLIHTGNTWQDSCPSLVPAFVSTPTYCRLGGTIYLEIIFTFAAKSESQLFGFYLRF